MTTGAIMMQARGIWPDMIAQCQNQAMVGSGVQRYTTHHKSADERKAARVALRH
jgi:hypothetical protein